MIIEQSKISNLLKILKGFIDVKSINTYTQGILIKGNKMIATNLNLSCIAQFENSCDAEFVLPVKAIEYILMLPGGEIELTQDDNKLTVKSGRRQSKFSIMSVEEFPKIEIAETTEKSINVKAEEFTEAVSKVLYACAVDDGKVTPIMTGVKFEAKDEQLNIIACNGNRLAWNVLNSKGNFDEVLPKSLLQKLLSLNITGDINISVNKNKIYIKSGNFTLVSKKFTGTYFAWEKLFVNQPKTKIVIDRNEVTDCVSRSIICSDNNKPMIINIVSGSEEIIVKNLDSTIEFEEVVKSLEAAPKDLKIGFNPKFFIECIKSYDDTDVDMYYNGANDAVFFDDGTLKTLILPIRLKGEEQ